MAAIAKEDLTPYNLGHLGLVGAFIRETGIIEKIDSMIPKLSNNPGNFTHGEVVALMILNGLGYTSRPLYMTHTFFEAKDVEAMLGIEYESSWFNDDVIGRTMDEMYEYGLTPLFSDLALTIMKSLGRKIGSVNVDSTSFHYHGKERMYHEDNSKVNYDEPHKINVTYGYSRDAHPELVQVMEQMMVDNQTGIPLFMEPESGNTNDTKAFDRMTKIYESFRNYADDGYLCGDSQGKTYEIEDFGVKQVWLLVHSNAAEARNVHSVETYAQKELDKLNKKLKEYGKSYYSCEPDAQKEIMNFGKLCRYCKVVSSAVIKEEVPRRGRKPKVEKPEAEKEYRYKIDITLDIDQEYCDMVRRNRSFFVVATNDIQRDWAPVELLRQYKSQNRVERGFRFLKDPEFFADSIFLSKNERIQALLMIMTLSLAVFSGLEWKLRNAMKTSNVQLKNQVGKLTDKITMRYVFQIFDCIITVILDNGRRLFYHISEQAHRILGLLGGVYQETYGT